MRKQNLFPSFFCASNACGSACGICLCCLPLTLSAPWASCVPPLPALLVVYRGVWRGGSVVPSCGAVSLAARRSFYRVGRRGGGPLVLRSSSRGSMRAEGLRVGGSLALRSSSRLIGAGGGTVRLSPSACLGEAGRVSVWIMWSVLFSVDCFGVGVYINTCAWMLFSPFFVSWHVLVVWAVLWTSAPIALVIAPINRFLRGTNGSDFFSSIFISSHHSISRLLASDLLFAT